MIFVKAHLKFSAKNDVYIHDKLIFGFRKFPINLYTCSLHSLVEDYGHAITDSIYSITHENVLFDRVSFDSANPYGVIQLLGSCNGLVCVYIPNIILWNPTTRKSRMLPDSGTSYRCHVTYGFGYDELHDDYKVVESSAFKYNLTGEDETCEDDDIQVKVYSMRTNSWKTILSNSSIFLNGANYEPAGPEKSSIFLNGAIHWLVHELSHWGNGSLNLATRWGIFSHNLATDSFVVLPMPNFGDDDNNVTPKVNILGGCLALYCDYGVCMDVWVMKEYGVRESWTKVVSISFFMDLRDTLFETPKPLFLLMDGKILMNYGSSLRIYDSHKPHHEFDFNLEVEATTYIESLVSPDLGDGIKH